MGLPAIKSVGLRPAENGGGLIYPKVVCKVNRILSIIMLLQQL